MTKDEIFASILSREGGYVDHPDDRGGTNALGYNPNDGPG